MLAIARAMGADPFEVLATAAVRDAENGPDFVATLQERMPGVPIRILAGEEEAALAGRGVAVRHSRAPTAFWPISAAARWNWCGSIAASAGRRRRCAWG